MKLVSAGSIAALVPITWCVSAVFATIKGLFRNHAHAAIYWQLNGGALTAAIAKPFDMVLAKVHMSGFTSYSKCRPPTCGMMGLNSLREIQSSSSRCSDFCHTLQLERCRPKS